MHKFRIIFLLQFFYYFFRISNLISKQYLIGIIQMHIFVRIKSCVRLAMLL